MDRFDSREDVEWAVGPFDDGYHARIMGCGLDRCPNKDVIGLFAVKSWRAGWADADASVRAEEPDALPDPPLAAPERK